MKLINNSKILYNNIFMWLQFNEFNTSLWQTLLGTFFFFNAAIIAFKYHDTPPIIAYPTCEHPLYAKYTFFVVTQDGLKTWNRHFSRSICEAKKIVGNKTTPLSILTSAFNSFKYLRHATSYIKLHNLDHSE